MNNIESIGSRGERIEALLVRDNPRGMATVRQALEPGYLLRAARHLLSANGPIAIMTGFPVAGTLETDGPAATIVLLDALLRAGKQPQVWVEASAHQQFYPTLPHLNLTHGEPDPGVLASLGAALVIERPGAAKDGRFYNIRGVDISSACLPVEPVLSRLKCPLIAIGDGGNEAGMGKAGNVLHQLPIMPAVQSCDELIVADVSNWGGYALAMMVLLLSGHPPQAPRLETLLLRLVNAGAVDGVSAAPTPTEDGYPAAHGEALLAEIAGILAPHQPVTTEAAP
jgi:hypothetical protein